MNAPTHPEITPEQAANLVAEAQGLDQESRDELVAQYRWHVEQFGPAEMEVGGTLYTVRIGS
jgi:hypothetical protein